MQRFDVHAAFGRALALALACSPAAAAAQAHQGHATPQEAPPHHEMFERMLGGGWRIAGMAQAFPILTAGFGSGANDAVTVTEAYLTQPVVMFNIESPGSRVALRTTLNFEGITQPDGELTFGGWGEGFIDRRHPHTLVHEAMLSLNFFGVAGGALSLSAGKGFAPYGTDDPMARPVVKYPTNHHLSQVLERFTANVVYVRGGWSLEAGLFGGAEPTGPYDFSNIESFGDSWSARLARRFGGTGTMAPWEASASFARVVEEHHDERAATRLMNVALRHERRIGTGTLYALVEASRSDPDDDDGYWSVLGEAQLRRGGHGPYLRFEAATRPEYAREGAPGTDGFYRYDHDAHPIGATRWTIATAGWEYTLTGLPVSARPFIELQHHSAAGERGGISARELFGTTSFQAVTVGFRMFFGGGPMRMGSYGVLDPITEMRPMQEMAPGHEHHD